MDASAPYRPPPWREQLQAVLLAAVCSIAFLGAGLLPGRALLPYAPERIEPLRSEALAEGRIAPAALRLGNRSMGDKLGQSITWDRILADRLRAGELPLWTRDIGGGAALVPQMGQIYQPWNALLLLLPAAQVYGPWYLLHQVLFGWLAYRFLRRIGVGHGGACFGVVSVVLGLWTQARLHHNVMLTAALPFFGLLSCVHQLFVHRGGVRTVGLLALATGLSWLGGMPYLSLLATLAATLYAAMLALGAPPGRRLQPALGVAVALALGGSIGLAQIGPVLLAASGSARDTPTLEQLAAHSLDWVQTWTLVWPDLFVWPGDVFYAALGDEPRLSWQSLFHLDTARTSHVADSFPETAFAIGVPGLALACAGLGHAQRRTTVFFGALAVLAFGIAQGARPLLDLARLLPGAGSGDVRRWLFLVAMGLAVLSALGFDRLRSRGSIWLPASLCAGVAIASLVFLLQHTAPVGAVEDRHASLAQQRFGVAADAFHSGLADGEAIANRDHLLTTFGRGLLVSLLALSLLATSRRTWARLGLIALNAATLIHAGHGTIVAVDSERLTRPPAILAPAIAATRTATGPRPRFQRLVTAHDDGLVPVLMPNLGAFYGLEDLAAYNPLAPRRMEELFTAIAGADVARGGAGVTEFRNPATLAQPMLDVLGLEWILADATQEQPGLEDRTPAANRTPFRLYRRRTTLPRATFVTRARIVTDRQERLAALGDPHRDAANEVILEADDAPMPKTGPPVAAQVAVVDHRDESVRLHVDTTAPGYLRLADPWDPGWTATVDGGPARLYVADHYLRAVWLEAGAHDVEFRYDAPVVTWPRRIALLGSLVALALLSVRGGRR